MDQLNEWLHRAGSNYILIAIAAVVFFLAKAITGYMTYRKFDKKLKRIERKIDKLLKE
ncbi:hypothetical protein [Mesobacillus foraminis]|uniref:hypothetical protein n=1 Tax=Mesobacillus foraminis TaxID=279826 RepID=UPI001304C43A|nr:hypothetical protein [Mesobacillus foraminis]